MNHQNLLEVHEFLEWMKVPNIWKPFPIKVRKPRDVECSSVGETGRINSEIIYFLCSGFSCFIPIHG